MTIEHSGTPTSDKKASAKNLRLAAGLAVSVLFGWLALRGVDYQEATAIAWQINLLWLTAGVLLLAVGTAAKASRWQLLFYPVRSLRWLDLLSAMMVGYLVNTVLPARLGELARVYLVSRTGRAAPAHTLSTIVVERVLDSLTLLIFLVAVMPFLPVPDFIRRAVLTLGLGGLLVFGVMLAMALRADHGLALFSTPLRLAPIRYRAWLTAQLENALSGLEALRTPRVHLAAWGWSLLIWALLGGSIHMVMLAFHLRVPVATAILLVSILNLGMVIPSSPGYIGVYHFLAVQTLGPFGVTPSVAMSFAIILHLANFGSLSLGGLVCMVREGLSFSDLSKRPVESAAPTKPALQ
jgi:uncharacterized protein (TIRG00374 family)